MSDDQLDRIVKVMRDVQEDCRSEAMALDGQPFDGKTVATQLGNMLAEISAVAKAIEVIAGHLSFSAVSREQDGQTR
jgi:hypothetical protein